MQCGERRCNVLKCKEPSEKGHYSPVQCTLWPEGANLTENFPSTFGLTPVREAQSGENTCRRKEKKWSVPWQCYYARAALNAPWGSLERTSQSPIQELTSVISWELVYLKCYALKWRKQLQEEPKMCRTMEEPKMVELPSLLPASLWPPPAGIPYTLGSSRRCFLHFGPLLQVCINFRLPLHQAQSFS